MKHRSIKYRRKICLLTSLRYDRHAIEIESLSYAERSRAKLKTGDRYNDGWAKTSRILTMISMKDLTIQLNAFKI
jgi:hypothetical protein